MKENKLWLRVLSLCLAMVCTFSIVAAATDLSNDGKTDVWDLQKAANEGKDAIALADILKAALGGHDELHADTDGVYKIYSPLGLYNMAKLAGKADAKFELMQNVDLGGINWTPTVSFAGTFEGNGYAIQNVNITKAVAGGSYFNQGFFSKIGRDAVVRNLKLENVTVDASELPSDKNNFIGLLAGSSTGTVSDCTSIGKVIDTRTSLTEVAYIGTLIGRIENVDYATAIGVTDDSVLMDAESAELLAATGRTAQKVLCKMALDLGTLTSGTRQYGIVGWAPEALRPSLYNWQDISGACTVTGSSGKTYNLQDPILEARRQAVVDKMYKMCTVEWRPSEKMTMHYFKITVGNESLLNYSTKQWNPNSYYRGMPYNHGSGSYERFLSWMDGDAENGYITKAELPDQSFYYTHSGVRAAMNEATDKTNIPYIDTRNTESTNDDKTYDLSLGYIADDEYAGDQALSTTDTVISTDHAGFSRYIGNDCSQAIQWAWREVISSDVANGGTVISGVTQMAPTTTYQKRYGVLPVGELVPSGYSVKAWDALYTEKGQNGFMDAYAKASKGDALIVCETAGGHSRLIAFDPICIRNGWMGTIQSKSSYIVTHEQGGGGSSGTDENGVRWSSSCATNKLYNFDQLTSYSTHSNSGDGSNCKHYLPMTLPAFHDVNSKAVNTGDVVNSYVKLENGTIKSNFFILSTAVGGNEVFTAIGQHQTTDSTTRVGSGYRDAHIQVDLTELKAAHGDNVASETAVVVRLSNGDRYTVDMTSGAVTKN